MALLDSEVRRIKVELGYNALSYAAEPYIGVAALFEQVIQPYLLAGAVTSSDTTVTASTSPALTAIVLDSATGFHLFDQVVIDVDDSQETATVRSLVGTTIGVMLTGAHDGTYPVTVEGGESMAREMLKNIRRTRERMTRSQGTGALKKVDEIEFYQSGGSNRSQFATLADELDYWRTELARVLGVQRLNRGAQGGGGSRCTLY